MAKKHNHNKSDKRAAKAAAQMEQWKLEYGPTAAKLFSKTKSPKQRYRLKQLAQARGVSVEGLAQAGTPLALKEKNRSNLIREAQDTVNRAYNPVFQEYDKVESKLDAVNQLRANDEREYRNWLTARADAAKNEAAARDKDSQAYVDKTYSDAAAARKAAQDQANARLAGATQGLQGPAAQVTQNASADQADAASRRYAGALSNINASARQGWDAQIAGQMGSREKERAGKLFESKQELGLQRANVRQQKGSTFAQMLEAGAAREIEKATQNRAFKQAMQELKAKVESDAMGAQLEAAKFAQQMQLSKEQLGLDQAELGLKAGDTQADNDRADAELERKRKKDAADAKKGPAGKKRKVLTNSERNKIKGDANFWMSTLKQVMRKEKVTYNRARALVKARVNRGDYQGHVMGGTAWDIADNLYRNKGKLDKRGRQRLVEDGFPRNGIPGSWS